MDKVDPGWDGDIDEVPRDEELEELDNMLDGILDFPDFPMEGLDGVGFASDWDASKSQYLGPIPMDVLMGTSTMSQMKIETGAPLAMHKPVAPIDTAPETKHLTYRFDDASASCIRRDNKSTDVHETGLFQSQSPVSVLESSSSSLAVKSSLKPHIAKRTRSKRARPSGMSPWLLISPFVCTMSTSRRTQDARKTKERRRKSPRPSVPKQTTEDSYEASDYANGAAAQPRPAKKCTHCEITKTPQWREGPLGPKTLCNACGVRYRSGRLFPEYRPAASPTFVPSLHSNSHKKVIEMRTKGKKVEEAPSMSPQLEFIPVSSYLFDPIC